MAVGSRKLRPSYEIQIILIIMLRKFSFYFSKPTGISSFQKFLQKYDLELQNPQFTSKPRVIEDQLVQKEINYQQTPLKSQIAKKIAQQESDLKKKYLLNRVEDQKPFKEQDSYYNFYSRPQNLYIKKRSQLFKERIAKSDKIVKELEKGEEGIDQVRIPEEYSASVNHERLQGVNWMNNAILELNDTQHEKSKAADIKEWRETNKLLEPLDLKINRHLVEQYKKQQEVESIFENPSGFAEWFAKTQPRETIEKLSQLSEIMGLKNLNKKKKVGKNVDEKVQTTEEEDSQFTGQSDIYTAGSAAVM